MGSKGLLVLALLLASVLLLSAEVPPKDLDQKFDQNEDQNGVHDMKYDGDWWGRYGGYRGWRRGWYCPYGCCRWSYYGNFCVRCCYYREYVDAHTDAEPLN